MRTPPRGGSRGRKERVNRQVRVDHPFKPGDNDVAVIRLAVGRRAYLEGFGRIERCVPGEADTYDVRFNGNDDRLYRRVVHPLYQSGPEAFVTVLVALWRAEVDPAVREMFDFPSEPALRGKRPPARRKRRRA
jgi:hypothetical protein